MKHTIKVLALLLAAVMLFALAGCGNQESEKKTLTLGTSADYPPFEFHILDENNKDVIVGYDISVAQAIAENMGAELVIKDMPFKSLLTELGQGTVDFVIACMEPNEERMAAADFSDPYYTDVPPMVVTLKADAAQYTSLDDFAGKTVGAQTGTVKADLVTEMMPTANLMTLQGVNELVNGLVNKKCDAIVLDGGVALKYVETNDDLVALDAVALGESAPNCVAVAKGDPKGLLEDINKAVAKIHADKLSDGWMEEADALSSKAIGLE